MKRRLQRYHTGWHTGWTLIEVAVALSIVVILTLIAIPSFVTFTQNQRIRATAENLYYALQDARSEAIKNNTTVYISFQTGDNWCYGLNSGSACNCSIANSCGIMTVSANAAQQITVSTTGLSSNSLSFESTHGAANASGSVTLTLYGQTSLITISIARLGNIQMCSTGISGYTAC